MPTLAMGLLASADAAPDSTTSAVQRGVALIAIASAVGVATKFIRVPYTVALVVAGLALALLMQAHPLVHVTEKLVLVLFLPPLLFQAGLHLDLGELRRHWVSVAIMAIPGVLVSTAAAAAAIRFILPLAVPPEYANWTTALVLGAIVAPTDPISVLSIFGQLGVSKRLRLLVEGESLFNDGTAAALFSVLKAGLVVAAVGGAAPLPSAGEVAIEFLRVTGIGAVVGLGLGLATFWILKRLNDHTLETGITVALAWGAFVAAEWVHASGVIAVVVAGLLIGTYGKALAMAEETRITLTGFWDGVDFIVNSVVFLLVGMELAAPEIGGWRHLIDAFVVAGAGAVLGALFVSRALMVFIAGLGASLIGDAWGEGWKRIIWWAGLRGGLSLALVLGLPAGPARDYLLPVVFLVVLVTLIGQATTMQFVVRRAASAEAGIGSEVREDPGRVEVSSSPADLHP